MSMKTCYKFSLVAFNIIFVIIGALVLGVGIWVKYGNDSFMSAFNMIPNIEAVNEAVPVEGGLTGLFESAALLLIIAGAVLFVIAFLGCCGAWKEIKLFLMIYAIIQAITFVGMCAGVIMFFAFPNTVNEQVEEQMVPLLREQYTTGVTMDADGNVVLPTETATLGWDLIQFKLGCCAVMNASEYIGNTVAGGGAWDNTYTMSGVSMQAQVPPSCCKITGGPSSFNADDVGDLEFTNLDTCMMNKDPASTNMEGCYPTLLSTLSGYSIYCIAIGCTIAFIQLIAVFIAYQFFKELCAYTDVK